ncbi:MAG TPA: S1C family serine protease [Ilumatobacteraceae bacterium]|nr:S1C family serine protease [Ilumatobacteraceae bacterium]
MAISDDLSSAARTVLVRTGPSVVSIGTDGRGSGIVIAPGKVLTNSHNLRDRTTLVTFADGRAAQGSVSGVDDDGDVVVLDVDTESAPAITWAETVPAAGEIVFALSRGGQRARISFGMVSSADVAFHGPRGRQVQGGVEHTAPLPRGSSGGPITDAQGRVVGVNTHRTGRGFYVARPIDDVLRSTIGDLAAGKSVVRPRLGIALAPPHIAARLRASVGLPGREGLLVRGVEAEGRAAAAGIAEGDLLVAAGDTPLTSIDALHDAVAAAGDSMTLTVVRGTEERTVVIDLSAKP